MAAIRKNSTNKLPARQNATVRIPKALCEEASVFIGEQADACTLNELVVESLREKLRKLREKSIDEAFAGMATDARYQQVAQQIANEFESSDFHALQQAEKK